MSTNNWEGLVPTDDYDLYDLVDKSKNEYTSASSYTPDNGNKLTFSSVDTYVIVLNKKGKYAPKEKKKQVSRKFKT